MFFKEIPVKLLYFLNATPPDLVYLVRWWALQQPNYGGPLPDSKMFITRKRYRQVPTGKSNGRTANRMNDDERRCHLNVYFASASQIHCCFSVAVSKKRIIGDAIKCALETNNIIFFLSSTKSSGNTAFVILWQKKAGNSIYIWSTGLVTNYLNKCALHQNNKIQLFCYGRQNRITFVDRLTIDGETKGRARSYVLHWHELQNRTGAKQQPINSSKCNFVFVRSQMEKRADTKIILLNDGRPCN